MADTPTEDWYFDIRKGVAVRASERGPGDHLLGPYPTKGHAENWRATNEARNESWDDDDERWDAWGDGDAADSDAGTDSP
jgi:hypothetical protein